ncbi:MAG TPA: DUF433 domain-containing protein [Pirellulales bacterium]|jgi:uncharacterized protein (DUF433 family)|nr:DUF433 domain-containing protein [Pirellulales bacterium]
MNPPISAASTENAAAAESIVKTPGTCSGQPRIAGTRIKVKHVYTWIERMGMTPAQIVAQFPHLTMSQVLAAVDYYGSHRDEILQDIANEEKLVAELKAKAGPSKILEGLAELDAADDPHHANSASIGLPFPSLVTWNGRPSETYAVSGAIPRAW